MESKSGVATLSGHEAEQFQYGFANAVSQHEAQVDSTNPDRGPLLIISADQDHTVPETVAKAAFKRQQRNIGTTEMVEIRERGHALTIDHGWREVADTALALIRRFV
jgi:non-heme chloroperoxidase